MHLRQFPRILKRLHSDKRAIVPVIAAVARGLAVAGKGAAKGAAAAGRAAGKAAGKVASRLSKGAAKAGQAAEQTAVKTEQVAASATAGGTAGGAVGAASKAASATSAEAKFSQTVTEKMSSMNKQLGQIGNVAGGAPGQPAQVPGEIKIDVPKQEPAEAQSPSTTFQQPSSQGAPPEGAVDPATGGRLNAAGKFIKKGALGGAKLGARGIGAFGKKMFEQGEGGHSPNIATTLVTVAGVLVSLLTFNSSGISGVMKILPFVLFIISMAMIIFSMGKSVPGWVILIATSGFWVYSSSGMAGLPALIPLFLVLAGIILLDKTKEHRGMGSWFVLVAIFTLAFYLFMIYTAPYATAAISEGGGAFQLASESAEETAKVGSKGGTSALQKAIQSFNKQKAAATGQRVEGEVDTKAQEDAKLELLDDFLENPKTVNENLLDFLEMRARVMAFDAKTEIHVAVTCHLQSEEEAAEWRRTYSTARRGGLNKNPGSIQNVDPGEITGKDFTKKLICTPDIKAHNQARNEKTDCGDYIVTISAQADHLRTDAQLQNYILDEKTYEQALYNYAEAKDTTLSYKERLSATKKIFPEVEGYKSKSYVGPIKVTMSTLESPLIPISDRGTNLALTVAVENNADGWLRGINDLEITIPASLSPRMDACRGWKSEGNKLILTETYLKTVDFEAVPKGEQAVFPSCPLVPIDLAGLTEPSQVEFLAMVDYNYIIQKPYDIEVRNETGGKCVKKKK